MKNASLKMRRHVRFQTIIAAIWRFAVKYFTVLGCFICSKNFTYNAINLKETCFLIFRLQKWLRNSLNDLIVFSGIEYFVFLREFERI